MTGPACDELEVIWPLHRWHYLSLPAPERVNMETVDESLSVTVVTPGRELAARALLAGPDGSQQRVSDLLGVSRRTIGRMAEADCTPALRDPQGLEAARTCLAETASRGSTVEERAAATAWLQAARDAHQVARGQASRRPAARRPRRRPARHVARENLSKPDIAAALRPQVDALRRQQQRIAHRTALIHYVLAAEKQSGQTLTVGDALAELLEDITEAAHTIGTILQAVGNGRMKSSSGSAQGRGRSGP
jgi:hypothetical protein